MYWDLNLSALSYLLFPQPRERPDEDNIKAIFDSLASLFQDEHHKVSLDLEKAQGWAAPPLSIALHSAKTNQMPWGLVLGFRLPGATGV